jgi:hypothetical protein
MGYVKIQSFIAFKNNSIPNEYVAWGSAALWSGHTHAGLSEVGDESIWILYLNG